MRIGYDGKAATDNATYLGNYSRTAINALANYFPDNEYIIYSSTTRSYLPQLSAVLEKPGVRLCGPRTQMGRLAPTLWRLSCVVGLAKRQGIDLYHGLVGALPFDISRSGIPTVATVADVMHRDHPELFNAAQRTARELLTAKAVRSATRVIANSQTVKDRIIRYYKIDPWKIDVVYPCCNPRFNANRNPDEIDEVKRIYGVDGRYIISVGDISERKNQLMPLRALPSLPSDVSLVLVGKNTPYTDNLLRFAASNGLTSRLRIINHIDYRHLPDLYAGAELASYTSIGEGFGMAAVEAIQCGTPVIVTTGSCLEEITGPETTAVNPNDVEAFVNSARAIIDEPATRQRIVSASRLYTSKYNPKSFADGLMSTYTKALKH